MAVISTQLLIQLPGYPGSYTRQGGTNFVDQVQTITANDGIGCHSHYRRYSLLAGRTRNN